MLEGRKRLIVQSGFTESSLCQKQLEEYRYGDGVRKKLNLILPNGFNRKKTKEETELNFLFLLKKICD